MSITALDLIGTQLKFLAFQSIRIGAGRDRRTWLIYVFFVTWLVGIGRYWDHPSADTWQYLGLGSVAYIVTLSALLYLVIKPLRPERWEFSSVLVFVGLTSLPALLYAIPVEKWTELGTAQLINVWFLGIVALWRVALLFRYLTSYAKLSWIVVLVAMTLILSGIIVTLTLLNLEHVVFDLMAGIRPENASPNDMSYVIVLGLAFYSVFAFPVVFFLYLAAIVVKFKRRTNET